MKNALILSFIALMALSCAQDKQAAPAPLRKDSILIDVRTAGEYQGGHLDDAVNIPYDEIGERIAEHVKDKEAEITVYCRSGRRSAIAKQTLEKLGYQRVTNAGAYAKLKAQAEGKSKLE